MVTIDKVQHGLAKFIDRELVPALTGWEKVVVGGGSGLLVAKLPGIISKYADNSIVGALGLYDPESRMIDIETLYQSIAPQVTEKLPLKIPFIGLTLKIGRAEIDSLYNYIMEV